MPNTDLEGVNADSVWDVTAADVVGYLGLAAPGQSDTDFYSFTAQANTLINFELMSVALTRTQAPAGTAPNDSNQGPFDTYLVIYNSSGQIVAVNDDSFQDSDSTIIDLTLPRRHLLRDGDLVAQVSRTERAADRRLRLFMYTFATGTSSSVSDADTDSGTTTPAASGLGDTMYAGSGNDTIVAGTGDDTIAGSPPQDVIIFGSGTVNQLAHAPYLDVSAGTDFAGERRRSCHPDRVLHRPQWR